MAPFKLPLAREPTKTLNQQVFLLQSIPLDIVSDRGLHCLLLGSIILGQELFSIFRLIPLQIMYSYQPAIFDPQGNRVWVPLAHLFVQRQEEAPRSATSLLTTQCYELWVNRWWITGRDHRVNQTVWFSTKWKEMVTPQIASLIYRPVPNHQNSQYCGNVLVTSLPTSDPP